jgi:hypothetical protein
MNLIPILKIGGEWLSAEDAAKRGLILTERQSNGIRRVRAIIALDATHGVEEIANR